MDEFTFDDLTEYGESTQTTDATHENGSDATATNETNENATPSVTTEQFADLQRQLESERKWKQDFGRMLLGQNQQEQQQQDPNAILTELLQDPIRFKQNTVEEAARIARQEMEQQAIIQDRKQKHPELSAIEHLIDWGSVMNTVANQFVQQQGRPPSFAEALDGSINQVKKNLQGLMQGNQAQAQGQAASRMAMNLDLSGGQPTSQPVDVFKMSDSEWVKYRDSVLRAQSGY